MSRFPGNKKFAFTIFDDTDLSTVANVSPIYRLLTELGMRTTKSVWPLASVAGARFQGSSLQERDYLDFVLSLRREGFEIALHNVRNHHSRRELVEQGIEEFRRLLGHYPRLHANHSSNRDNIYWGPARLSQTPAKFLYRLAAPVHNAKFEGHIPGSPYFWGDLCRDRIEYVRNFVFDEINLDRIDPHMPYHDASRPFVNSWFSACNGENWQSFCTLLSEANQDRLEAEAGICIAYTHFACGFCVDGEVHPRVEQLLRRLALKDGWFVPVSVLLDHLRQQRNGAALTATELAALERRWVMSKLRSARSFLLRNETGPRRLRAAPGGASKLARVVHLTSAHPALDSRIFYKQCCSLARAGYEVVELATHPSNALIEGVHIHALRKSKGRLDRIGVKFWQICGQAVREQGDIYHFHDPELLPIGLLLRALGKQVVYDIHEDLPRTVLYKSYLPRALRPALVWLSERLENLMARAMSGLATATPAIARRFEPLHRNTVVISNFPILKEIPLPQKSWRERDMAVAYIGGISAERGMLETVQAMALLPCEPQIRLRLAGRFFSGSGLDELAKVPGWERVDWLGMLKRPQVVDLLGSVRAGLVVLHPEENFVVSQPIKLFEYMAAGIPVIASDFPLWRDMIQKADCGLLVDPLDPQSIADAISFLFTHPEKAEQMGRCGRQAVEQRYNWTSEERKLLALYQSLLKSKAQPAGGHAPLSTEDSSLRSHPACLR